MLHILLIPQIAWDFKDIEMDEYGQIQYSFGRIELSTCSSTKFD